MFGLVPFRLEGSYYVATLNDDRTWSFEPALPWYWSKVLPPFLGWINEEYGSPSDGPWGYCQLRDAAKYLGNPGRQVVISKVGPGKSTEPLVY